MAGKPQFFREMAREARCLRPRSAWTEILRRFEENDLLTYASAISFRVFFALIPLALLGVALLGMLGLGDVWRDELAPRVETQTSAAAFEVIDQTVQQVVGSRKELWATLGALIAIWEVSAAMRAVMGVTGRIYDAQRERSFKVRFAVSLWLAALVSALVFATVACVIVLPRLIGGGAPVKLLGWLAALGLLFGIVVAVVRFAPARDRPITWVGFGAVLVVVGWIGTSLLYGWYVTSVAHYDSVFGSLAVVMVTLGFIYALSLVFVTGLQLDALIRDAMDDRAESEDEERPQVLIARSASEALAEHQLGGGADSRGVA